MEACFPNTWYLLDAGFCCAKFCVDLACVLNSLAVFTNIRGILFDLLCLFSCSMLADKLNMTPEEAERWIVNLIRNARLDAKLDSKLVRLYRWFQVNLIFFFFYLTTSTLFFDPVCKMIYESSEREL